MPKLVKVFKIEHYSADWSQAMISSVLAPYNGDTKYHNQTPYTVSDRTIQYALDPEGVHEVRYTLKLQEN